MKVWIELRKGVGADGYPVDRYDAVTAEGESVLGGMATLNDSAHDARERARQAGHQIMTIPRPRARR